ncbi:hypothetical protein PAPYR_4615 [Paratrimastix pyriformis]|uniref:Peptidase C19 ubiquitin carboxyl-terminal hydrolase domain-containing protein n=1 Tax=Paratrimastix pyriformis TaxID=342808 RepID=A0ABQ8UJC1_9EUKA|nr:hypothetical protein PAPYR_4615 [Paratrimastix pyriformis]
MADYPVFGDVKAIMGGAVTDARIRTILKQFNGDVERTVNFLVEYPEDQSATPSAPAAAAGGPPPVAAAQTQPPVQANKRPAHGEDRPAPPVTSNNASHETDLDRAIKASLKDEEDRARRAIQPRDDEVEMNRAILESIKDASPGAVQQVLVPLVQTKREPGMPTGLCNVGNTCYFNSLLQTYFMMPAFRRAVLECHPRPPPPPPPPATGTVTTGTPPAATPGPAPPAKPSSDTSTGAEADAPPALPELPPRGSQQPSARTSGLLDTLTMANSNSTVGRKIKSLALCHETLQIPSPIWWQWDKTSTDRI